MNIVSIINNKWVFVVKLKPDKTLKRYKNRLVVRGSLQTKGIDYNETFSPVVKPTMIWVVLLMAFYKGWIVRQLDMNNAFQNCELAKVIFMYQL